MASKICPCCGETFGPPALQCGFANVPTVGQLALVKVFDTHVLVLSCDC